MVRVGDIVISCMCMLELLARQDSCTEWLGMTGLWDEIHVD